ncbi:MAG TPA: ABC transporter ATP-binding protein [Alcanivorax sp.]|jgi:branched-chain amino acid transport system ATP-binding protein|nr:ABC transporter ATP-binding protein [Alcanivorax sp.]HBP74772.1 ABC transporter ATP-binding protein [Alcanivorax sp.]|tara:strand:- start:6256 stop:7029 length:774 start_codon:yes stop_codon:yes gene_type:complete
MTDEVLGTRRLSKRFKGFTAVDNVDLSVQKGHIHALIGPNGAGKTTLFNLLTRFTEPSAGEIHFNGRSVSALPPREVARRGMVRSFQISAVFASLSVLDNVRLALQRELGMSFHFWKSDRVLNRLNDRAMALLESVGLTGVASHAAGSLPYGHKRALELATTLAMDPVLMLLDEPTQGMGYEDVDRVTALIQQVAVGRTVLMVEHNMKVVASIADTLSVLQRGRLIASGSYQEVSTNPRVMEAYMGTAPGHGKESVA